jgi:hypothetical protein
MVGQYGYPGVQGSWMVDGSYRDNGGVGTGDSNWNEEHQERGRTRTREEVQEERNQSISMSRSRSRTRSPSRMQENKDDLRNVRHEDEPDNDDGNGQGGVISYQIDRNSSSN